MTPKTMRNNARNADVRNDLKWLRIGPLCILVVLGSLYLTRVWFVTAVGIPIGQCWLKLQFSFENFQKNTSMLLCRLEYNVLLCNLSGTICSLLSWLFSPASDFWRRNRHLIEILESMKQP